MMVQSLLYQTNPCGPKRTGFFLHRLLLKSTAGRRRQQRYKGAVEGGSKGAKGRHQCRLCTLLNQVSSTQLTRAQVSNITRRRPFRKNLIQASLVQPCQPASRSLVPLLVQPWELGARKNFIFDEFASLWHVFVVLQVCMTKQSLS